MTAAEVRPQWLPAVAWRQIALARWVWQAGAPACCGHLHGRLHGHLHVRLHGRLHGCLLERRHGCLRCYQLGWLRGQPRRHLPGRPHRRVHECVYRAPRAGRCAQASATGPPSLHGPAPGRQPARRTLLHPLRQPLLPSLMLFLLPLLPQPVPHRQRPCLHHVRQTSAAVHALERTVPTAAPHQRPRAVAGSWLARVHAQPRRGNTRR